MAENISDFYNGTNILITGATGFLGKVLLEKLLRSCQGIGKIYLLIRPKKNIKPQQRLEALFKYPVFNVLREQAPEVFEKVVVLDGDVSEENLGIKDEDRSLIQREINIIFHLAASIRFDGDLKETVICNVLGTKQIIQLCKEIHNLKSFVHVSTAFSNADKLYVEEIVYEPEYQPEAIINLVHTLPSHILAKITPNLIGNHPNMYTFSKGLAEKILADHSGNIPVVIVRPSIVNSSWKEPFPGWVDGYGGATGIVMPFALGIVDNFHIGKNVCANLIPVDIVVNTIISSPWHNSIARSPTMKVYNCVSGPFNKLTWNTFTKITTSWMLKNPTQYVLGYPRITITENRLIYLFNFYFVQFPVAIIYDAFLYCTKRKPMAVRISRQTKNILLLIDPVVMLPGREFRTETFTKLREAINLAKDREEFDVDMRKENGFDWNEYLKEYVLGIRRYLFKDISDVAKARIKLNWLYWIEKIIKIGLFSSLFYIVLKILKWYRYLAIC